MKLFLRVLDFVVALWIIGAVGIIVLFSPFLFDSPEATVGIALWMSLKLFLMFAGFPLMWVIGRLYYARYKKSLERR